MKKILVAALLAVACIASAAATEKLQSFTIYALPGNGGSAPPCSGGDQVFSYPTGHSTVPAGPMPPGAGGWPVGAFWIQGVELAVETNDPAAYAVMGITDPYGDYATPRTLGAQRVDRFYPSGTGFLFPNDGTAWMHIHVRCGIGKWMIPYLTVYWRAAPGV